MKYRTSSLIFFLNGRKPYMAEEKTTSRMTSATNDMDWYTANGWQVFNKLLTELAANRLDIVWIENFDLVRQALNHINRKTLIQKFNADCLDWQMKSDSDGTLYVCRNN